MRLDVAALAQVGVHDLALHRAHRLELDGPVVLQRLSSRPVRHAVQGSGAAFAVPGRVDGHLLAVIGAAESRAEHQVLDGVDRRPVLPDQESEVVAVHRRAYLVFALVDVHRRAEAERLDDARDNRAHALRRLFRDLVGHRKPGLMVDLARARAPADPNPGHRPRRS